MKRTINSPAFLPSADFAKRLNEAEARYLRAEKRFRVLCGVLLGALLLTASLPFAAPTFAQGYSITLAQAATRIAALEAKTQDMSRVTDANTNKTTVRFSGVNVQIVDGTSATEGAQSGLGNLIIGYNELRSGSGAVNTRTGNHNLIAGIYNNYSGNGGVVFGYGNNISSMEATVTGGLNNTASSDQACVSGGRQNAASGPQSSVSGGAGNMAIAYASSVSGGTGNTTSGNLSSVSGGVLNTASRFYSSVSGGSGNMAGGERSSISGGVGRTLTSENSWAGGSYTSP